MCNIVLYRIGSGVCVDVLPWPHVCDSREAADDQDVVTGIFRCDDRLEDRVGHKVP